MNIVKELRERAGMQQKQIAVAVGVSRPTVSEWEHQKKDPSGDRLIKLAELFDVSTGVILGYDAIPGASSPSTTDDELWALRERLRRQPGMRTLFSVTRDASEDDLRQAVAVIEALKRTSRGGDGLA